MLDRRVSITDLIHSRPEPVSLNLTVTVVCLALLKNVGSIGYIAMTLSLICISPFFDSSSTNIAKQATDFCSRGTSFNCCK